MTSGVQEHSRWHFSDMQHKQKLWQWGEAMTAVITYAVITYDFTLHN